MIRLKNLDLNTPGQKRVDHTYLDVPSASSRFCVFVAPVDGTLDAIYLHGNSTASNGILITTGDSTVALAALLSAITVTSWGRVTITPTANNSLTAGTPVVINCSATNTLSFSVVCSFTPAKHQGTR